MKNYKEDNWSDDESVFNRQMKMPNIKATKVEYQREIGLNLDALVPEEKTQKTEPSQETLKDAIDLLP